MTQKPLILCKTFVCMEDRLCQSLSSRVAQTSFTTQDCDLDVLASDEFGDVVRSIARMTLSEDIGHSKHISMVVRQGAFPPQLIYVTSQGSQLIVEARELALESFAQPCFACHVSAVSFGMVKAWIETILHVFETSLLVCRSVGWSVRLSVVPPGPRSELCGHLECL